MTSLNTEMTSDVAAVFAQMPAHVSAKLLAIRAELLQIAESRKEIGLVEECLKWGEPSYLTHNPKSGTSIRLAWKEKTRTYGIYVPCQTRVIEDFKHLAGDKITYDKTRGLIFQENEDYPADLISAFLLQALTYHLK